MIRLITKGLAFLLVLGGLSVDLASATGYDYYWKRVVTHEKAIRYEIRQEAHTVLVTRYDECGRPYQVPSVCYREVRVPVEVCVPVTRWVKTCN